MEYADDGTLEDKIKKRREKGTELKQTQYFSERTIMYWFV